MMNKIADLLYMMRIMSKAKGLKKKFRNQPRCSLGLYIEEIASEQPNKLMLIFEGKEVTWGEFNGLANQLAHLFRKQGVKQHDCVALFMTNRIEYLACVVAASKLGAVAGLLNNNVRGPILFRCIQSISPSILVVGEELISSYKTIDDDLLQQYPELDIIQVNDDAIVDEQNAVGSIVFNAHDNAFATSNPEGSCPGRINEPSCYIFTSGTTGLPKAALFQTRRVRGAVEGFGRLAMGMQPSDRIYLTLPLYHATGLIISLGCLIAGKCSIVLRRKFSVSEFWPDVVKYQANSFVYIGEICRYLANNSFAESELNNPVTKCIGNGLRPDVWHSFKNRFGIKKIIEFYASSEGNSAFLNAFNKDCTIGFCTVPFELVKYDVRNDAIVRDNEGLCIPVDQGEPGLAVIEINEDAQFLGYTDKKENRKKIIKGVKALDDSYFSTGDLLKEVDVGFTFGLKHLQFVDRLGDTYRWKGENISTTEVSDVMGGFDNVADACVFGVELPKTDGQAGMLVVELIDKESEFDSQAFSHYLSSILPHYSWPVFVRIIDKMPTTSTFKHIKLSLRQQAFHLERCIDPIFFLMPGTQDYHPLDRDFYQKIMSGEVSF